MTLKISKSQARRMWMRAQKLDERTPFGAGAEATKAAVEHLGYVQIDTINVIERCHHHILFSRIPKYRKKDLQQAQAQEKSVFEYWTHALSYVPTRDFRFFMPSMKRSQVSPSKWFQSVKSEDMRKVLRLMKAGPLSIRDIKDDVLVEKEHEWASAKPSKRALQLGFYQGRFVISERLGMLKKYELTDRHFAWEKKPKAATEKEYLEYLIERSLRSQSLVSLDSICHLDAKRKADVLRALESRAKKKQLVSLQVEGFEKSTHWVRPSDLEETVDAHELVHILSPFDPLIIQRKRLYGFFDYNHLFEAYIAKEKRKMGYFALPVLIGEDIVAAVDLKTDREKKKLRMQKWTWLGRHKSASRKKAIEEELHRFEAFQLDRSIVED